MIKQKTSRIKKLNQAGDTIVEVMICLAIVAMVISGAYTSATRSLQVGQRAQERTEALKLAEAQIERIKFLSSNAASNIYLDPNDPFCIDGTYATNGDGSKVAIADNTVFSAAMYGACLQGRYHVSVIYSGGTNNLFTVEAVWERFGAALSADPESNLERLKLFYRQPPNLSVNLSPTPTIFTTPTPTIPPVGPGPGGSTCSPPYPGLTLRYNASSPGGQSFDTGISVPAGNLQIVTYESRSPNDNGLPPELAEQWHVSVGGVRSADTTDVTDVDTFLGYRSIMGSLPGFNQPGGNIILEHRNVQADPLSNGENSVTPYQFCYLITIAPTPTPTPTPTPPPNDCEFDVVRSRYGSLFTNTSQPTPGSDAVSGASALSGLFQSPNSTLYFSGLDNSCVYPGNRLSIRLYTDGTWNDTGQWADSVEVVLRNRTTYATAPIVSCPDQLYYTALKPAPVYGTSGAGWSNICYVANYNGGSVVLTFSTVGLGSPDQFEFLVFADGVVVPPLNASGVPEFVGVDGPF